MDVLYSVKEVNRLRKERNMLLSKGISNICLKVTIETGNIANIVLLEKILKRKF